MKRKVNQWLRLALYLRKPVSPTPRPPRPCSYDSLTLPSAKQMVVSAAITLLLLILFICSIPLLQRAGADGGTITVVIVVASLVFTYLPSKLVMRKPIKFYLFGEFAFRSWNIAGRAQVQEILLINDRSATKADRLCNIPIWARHLARVEIETRKGEPERTSYLVVSSAFADSAHPGKRVSVEYQMSRLHPSRIRVRLKHDV